MMKKTLIVLLCLLTLAGCGRQPVPEEPQTPAAPQAPALPETPPAQPEEPQASALPTVSGDRDPFNRTWSEMQSADFWIALCDDPQAVRMTEEQILDYNASLATIGGTRIENLAAWPESLSRGELLVKLNYYDATPSGHYYTGANIITAEQRAAIRENRNEAAVTDQNPVQYGFVVENALLRTYPSDLPLYDYPSDYEYDMAVETAFKIWEPVLVLHTSADGEWLLVQAYDYLGWLRVGQVGLCDRFVWDNLCDRLREQYVTVLAPRLAMDGSFFYEDQHEIVLRMGTRLPLIKDQEGADNAIADNCYIVELPLRRESDGALQTINARLPKAEDAIEGSLPYTSENLLRQVFKLLGHRYGWGGMAEGWDCSSICQDVYRTLGLMIPRNSGNQRQIPGAVKVEGLPAQNKQNILQQQLPGAMPELPGHQTMYIGTYEGESYVIHSTHGVYDPDGNFYNANSVIVSSVQALRSNGLPLLENFRSYSIPQ